MFPKTAWAKFCLAAVLALLALAVVVALATAFPDPEPVWLSLKGIGDDTQAQAYYTAIGAPATFSAWLSANGFPSAGDVRAIYYNAGDLGFGREMHCHQISSNVACYVINHGLGAGAPAQLSVGAAIANQNTLPAVAMVYRADLVGQPNDVQFFIYNVQNGQRLNGVQLDGQGTKYAPYLCLPCHGGTATTSTQMQGAHFLPFDAASFRYSGQTGYTLADQQEALRQLNALVKLTSPPTIISDLIDGWYAAGGGVNNIGSTFDDSYVPPSYSAPADTDLYNNVVKHYCRSCHIAQGIDLGTPALVGANEGYLFGSSIMPHSQLTNHNFWSSSAAAFLANNRGWSIRVNRTDDPASGSCAPGNPGTCSLRQAIIQANANPPGSINVITFDVYGTITLSQAGAGEDAAATGDLDLNTDMTILGNGPANTIIDGGGLDRVFQIRNGAHTAIQGVTIQGGSVDGAGGGIDNVGSVLDLVNSAVTSNYVYNFGDAGAGVASSGGATTHIVRSTIGPYNETLASGDTGGGLYNDASTLTLDSVTLTGNYADYGPGLYSVGSGSVVTLTHVTLTNNNGVAGALDNEAGAVLNMANSIVTGNSSGACLFQPGSSYQSLGHNLVGNDGSANGCSLGVTDSVVAGTTQSVLETNPVKDYSGLTYHPLVPGSPAIDAIAVGAGCVLPSYDERNVPRPSDGNPGNVHNCDAGAREFVRALVTTNLDVFADDGLCSLREAVYAATYGVAWGLKGGECPAGPDEIILSVPGPYNLDGNFGDLPVGSEIIVQGQGHTIRLTGGFARLFHVTVGGTLNLTGATLLGGNDTGDNGGAIAIDPGGAANIINSSLVGNSTAYSGGGIYNQGSLLIANSTLSGNSAGLNGGGIENEGTVLLTNVTIAGNTADSDADGTGDGGGLATFGTTVFIKNSLVAGNSDLSPGASNPDVYRDPSAIEFSSYDYNLIGNDTGAAGLFTQPHDQAGTSLSPIDPHLGQATGAPLYLPLLDGSPAIDRIPVANCNFLGAVGNPMFVDNTAVRTDQRGAPRPANSTRQTTAKCDIGAFERQVTLFLPAVRR